MVFTQQEKQERAKIQSAKAYNKRMAIRNKMTATELSDVIKKETLNRYGNKYNSRSVPDLQRSKKYGTNWLDNTIKKKSVKKVTFKLPPEGKKVSVKKKSIKKVKVFEKYKPDRDYITEMRAKANLSVVTKKTMDKYISFMNSIYKDLFDKIRYNDDYDWLHHTKEISQIILDKTTVLSSQQSYFAVFQILTSIFYGADSDTSQYYKTMADKYRKEYSDERDANIPSETQLEKVFDWVDFAGKRRIKGSTDLEYLLYLLITASDMPPRRAHIYKSMYIISDKTPMDDRPLNYIAISDTNKISQFTISDYKTKNSYGQITRRAFPRAFNLKVKKLTQGIELDTQLFGKVNLDNYTKSLLGYSTTYTLMRRAYATEWFKKNLNPSLATIRRIATKLGHSVEIMLSYRIL